MFRVLNVPVVIAVFQHRAKRTVFFFNFPIVQMFIEKTRLIFAYCLDV